MGPNRVFDTGSGVSPLPLGLRQSVACLISGSGELQVPLHYHYFTALYHCKAHNHRYAPHYDHY